MTPRLIPVKNGTKVAAVQWATYQDRAPTPEEITEWRSAFPGCNWGLLTGRPSGVVVLDVDVRHRGMDALRERTIPVTRTVLTWSGGWHYYFTYPGPGCRTIPAILPGCDLKGDGGYVLVPPSQVSGVPYELAVDAPVAAMPTWLWRLIPRVNGPVSGRPQSEFVMLLRGVDEGERNGACVKLAGWLIAHGLSADATHELLIGWNGRNRPPLRQDEIGQCVASIADAHVRNRAKQFRRIE